MLAYNVFLSVTFESKELREIVALLGISGRIGKNDNQNNKTLWDLLVK